ncbi:MAG: hypothetical protein MHM6MM_004843 [Cercozoa sp. M6MM]
MAVQFQERLEQAARASDWRAAVLYTNDGVLANYNYTGDDAERAALVNNFRRRHPDDPDLENADGDVSDVVRDGFEVSGTHYEVHRIHGHADQVYYGRALQPGYRLGAGVLRIDLGEAGCAFLAATWELPNLSAKCVAHMRRFGARVRATLVESD